MKIFFSSLLILLTITISEHSFSQDSSLTLKDVMKFKQIKNESISDKGNWIGLTAEPDRGNGEAVIFSDDGNNKYLYERGSKPEFSTNEKWTGITLKPEFTDLEKDKKDKPNNDFILLNLETGDTTLFKDINSFQFSKDSKWLALNHYEIKDTTKEKDKKKEDEIKSGTTLQLINLESNSSTEILSVKDFGFDSTSYFIYYSVKDTTGRNGLYLIDLTSNNFNKIIIDTVYNGNYTEMEWNKNGSLAFLRSILNEKDKPGKANLYIWNNDLTLLTSSALAPEGWEIPAKNKLKWSKDNERLYFGYKPEDDEEKNSNDEKEDSTEVDIYDFETILDKKEVDVWHWNDPLIKPNEKKDFKDKKNKTYTAVYDFNQNKAIQLTDLEMSYIRTNENPYYGLGYSGEPYFKERTWDGWYYDFYVVDLKNGSRKKIIEHLNMSAELSPEGKYIVYYEDENYHLYNIEKDIRKNLTQNLDVQFSNELHDYPSEPPGYGIAGWLEHDEAVLIYDRYDIWKFNTDDFSAENITKQNGRKNNMIYRIVDLHKDRDFYFDDEKFLLSGYNDSLKYKGYYSIKVDDKNIKTLIEDKNKNFSFKEKAKDVNQIIYTRESYTEYPDIWKSNLSFENRKRISNYTNQTEGFAWGKAELVSWMNLDGVPMQGVLIKPGNYEEGKRYPVLVYFYRYFSQRLNEFNDMVVNHRPNFPFYASNGYCVFLPDVVFEVGRPGYSATKSLVPGVQKLIDIGIAKPDGIALHGHSWSGYQTAFVVTQTDIFACAVAGAPVSNMTSAYSGIRWGSGLARQFQYEKSQSRIGGSLWQYPERYIENSPVFFADKIHTPLMIEHGDEDGAVPWYQSIELYLAMRRLNKQCIFLQYRGEPHHLKKYANKLDYSIKMKEYIDHYCKETPAPEWLSKGVPYSE